jgi:hypothetical protein
MRTTYIRFCCATCGALCSMPWPAAWCLHAGSNFTPDPPSHEESDWARMDIVVSVEVAPAPDGPWWVTESRNPYSWFPDGNRSRFPGKDKRSYRVVDGPFDTLVEALAAADEKPTNPKVPPYGHSFHALPDDLISEEMR